MGIKPILPPLLAAALVLAGCSAAGTGAGETAPPAARLTAAPAGETAAPPATAQAAPEPTAEPAASLAPEPAGESGDTSATAEAVPAVAAGTYTYDSPEGTWKLQLRADGLFTLTGPDGMPHTGEGWITEADGTVSCGPTDIYDEDFAFNGGCSRWSIAGSGCVPVIP